MASGLGVVVFVVSIDGSAEDLSVSWWLVVGGLVGELLLGWWSVIAGSVQELPLGRQSVVRCW